jgi:hypothetical protein
MRQPQENWVYKKLPSSTRQGSQVDWHQFIKGDLKITFGYDNGDDTETSVLVNGVPWGTLSLANHIFNKADFGKEPPFGLEKALEYIEKNSE